MARYRDAIDWIVWNDDTSWLTDAHGSTSVTAALVADLFGKDDATVARDLQRAVEKAERDRALQRKVSDT